MRRRRGETRSDGENRPSSPIAGPVGQCGRNDRGAGLPANAGSSHDVKYVRYIYRVSMHAFDMFLVDDGWAIASHIALSALMALFPFLIVLTALAGFFGSAELADQAADLMLDTWPDKVADAIAVEIHNVLTVAQGGVLTIGLILAIYFASNGVESLRVGLNRAYGVIEMRAWYWLRLESIGYTLLAAVALLSLAFLIVLAPLMIATARR
jgi:membrane protein